MFETLASIHKTPDTEKYQKETNEKTKEDQMNLKAAEWISTDRDFQIFTICKAKDAQQFKKFKDFW